jgi:hypothetical protein
MAMAWGDYDNDGDADVYVANDGRNSLCRNDGAGIFSDVAAGTPLQDAGEGRGVAWGDFDNDQDLDLYLSRWDDHNRLFRNDGGGGFVNVAFPIGRLDDPGDGQSVGWVDYDVDGDLDLHLVNRSSSDKLFRNDGDGFSNATSVPIGDEGRGVGSAWADFDGDGDPDVYVSRWGEPNRLYRNDQVTDNHWLHVDLLGSQSSRAGVGARIRMVTGDRVQTSEVVAGSGLFSMSSLTTEFGTGPDTVVDSIRVWWPSGCVTDTVLVAVDQVITIPESSTTGIGDGPLPGAVPTVFRLHASIPNPFNPSTEIRYDLPRRATVRLRVYDVSGRLVRALVEATTQESGRYVQRWDGRDGAGRAAPSGVYLCRLDAGSFSATRRLVLVR